MAKKTTKTKTRSAASRAKSAPKKRSTKKNTRTATVAAKKPRSTTTRKINVRKNAARTTRNKSVAPQIVTRDQIAERAYRIWEMTGNCNEHENWTEAERQLRAESAAK